MKDPFKSRVIVVTGDFGVQRSHENIKRWIESNGGKYAAKVDDETTHLICSKEHWKRQTAEVQKARRRAKIKIVTYDWLEDSLLQGKKPRSEGKYLLTKIEKSDKKLKAERKARERKSLKKDGTSKSSKFADSALAYLEQHKADLDSNAYASKPKVEPYSVYAEPATSEPALDDEGQNEDTNSTLEGLRAGRAEQEASSSGETSAKETTPGSLGTPFSSTTPKPTSKKRQSKTNKPTKALHPSIPAPLIAIRTPAPTLPTNDLSEIENHHLYRDITGFTYNITLVRLSLARNTNERYILRLYESHASPYTYATHLRYSQPGHVPESSVLAPVGSDWETAFAALKKVFEEKVGRGWADREVVTKRDAGAGEMDRIADGGTPFVYVRPKEGEPRGMGLVVRNPVTMGAVIG